MTLEELDQARTHRIGLIVPAGNRTIEPDFNWALPISVTVHANRVAATRQHSHESPDAMDDINSNLAMAARTLARVQCDIVVYGFTTATFYQGISHARELQARIAADSNCHAIVPSLAILDALQRLNARRISVVTPYPRWNNDVLMQFLSETSLEVTNFVGDERSPDATQREHQWNQKPSAIVDFVLQHADRGADAVLLPCTAWRALEVVSLLERELSMPIVTANQACIWAAAHMLNLDMRGG